MFQRHKINMATAAAQMEYRCLCPDRPWDDMPVYFELVDEPVFPAVQLVGSSIGHGLAVWFTADDLERLDEIDLTMHVALATGDAVAHWSPSN